MTFFEVDDAPRRIGDLPHIRTWNPKQPFIKWMLGETTIFYVKIWNHPIETSI